MPLLSLLLLPAVAPYAFQSTSGPLLMRQPTMNRTDIVFTFAGDLWSVPREGGNAVRITNSPGIESDACFSRDGTQIAFSGNYDGNRDVYVMPAGGGIPKRLTYHPSADIVRGWTPDGKNILFVSSMNSNTDLPRLYTVSTSGSTPAALPFPSGTAGSYSADGSKIAYQPGMQWQEAWKRYRGGQTMPIWVGQLADSKVYEIPRKNSNDTYPMWVGDKVYFLSDRGGPVTLYSYETGSKKVSQLIPNNGFDFKSASAGPGGIICEQLGSLKLYDTSSGKVSTVDVNITGDFPEVRPQFKDTSGNFENASLSPSGARAVFEARGDIYTVPPQKGDIRNITNTSGVAERSPAWSPDGKSIAYLSDAGGEYKLVIAPASGQGESKSYVLGDAPAYYNQPVWSPDSAKIAYSSNHHNLWVLDVKSGTNKLVDTAPYETVFASLSPLWSPDSKWITYHRDLRNHMNAVFLYNVDTAKATQVTDGLSDARFPTFDKNGKYLYFVASTNVGPGQAWLDLSSYGDKNTVSSVYCVVLRKDLPSPLAPESDEEKIAPTTPPPATTPPGAGAPAPAPGGPQAPPKPEFRIDLERIGQRVIALPLPGRNYVGMAPATAGSVFLMELGPLATITSQPRTTLLKFSIDSKMATPFASDLGGFTISEDGQKILLLGRGAFMLVPTAAPPQPGQGILNLASMQAKVDPRAEWRQIYHEAWRIQRDFFYDPNFHGQNLKALEARYEPFLANVMTREDLNYLFTDMLGELSVGHMFINGGDIPGSKSVPGGLLGADYKMENGRYRFSKIYNGENWNPGLRAPLTQPGVDVQAGEYLLAVNGKDLTTQQNVYEAFENTAGKQVTIKVGPNPDGIGSREVVVVPVANEFALRSLAWEEDNRRKVAELTGGKVGYVHIPDTNIGGWTNFKRYYFAQVGKEGMIIDERFNHGGQVDDYMVEMMNRPLASMWSSRYGEDFSSPRAAIYGPKVMIVNQYAGSGGDYFPWHFRKAGVGPIVGKRTWGGLVGILGFPTFVDGGGVTAPNVAFWNPEGKWEVENHGVDPDIEVEMDPYLWRQGKDPQLERAVAECMKLIDKQPKIQYKKPAYKDVSKLPPPTG
jgi:tricorn protease